MISVRWREMNYLGSCTIPQKNHKKSDAMNLLVQVWAIVSNARKLLVITILIIAEHFGKLCFMELIVMIDTRTSMSYSLMTGRATRANLQGNNVCVLETDANGYDSPSKKKPLVKTCNCLPKWCCSCCGSRKKRKAKMRRRRFFDHITNNPLNLYGVQGLKAITMKTKLMIWIMSLILEAMRRGIPTTLLRQCSLLLSMSAVVPTSMVLVSLLHRSALRFCLS